MSSEDIQKKLIKLLFAIKKRPLLYLTRRSILSLSDFYGGFCSALMAYMPNDRGWIINEFGSFIRDKHPELEYLDLFNILYEVSDHDEAKAFDLFFEEFESFLTKEGIEIPCFDK
ncbi:MAG: hypothetical protein K2N56_05860 [Oscillospiraceae bacterium]|nr:hypothetical protein [Oscillospiraceae bacterium]